MASPHVDAEENDNNVEVIEHMTPGFIAALIGAVKDSTNRRLIKVEKEVVYHAIDGMAMLHWLFLCPLTIA
jgi:hypothetical protein